MSRTWPALCLLLATPRLYANGFPIEVFEYVDSARIVTFINESDIGDAPNWEPFSGAPPLTVAAVADAIQSYIKSDAELSDPELEEIELRRLPHHHDQWHYMVKLRNGGSKEYRYFVVLMNGKVIPSIREPESIK